MGKMHDPIVLDLKVPNLHGSRLLREQGHPQKLIEMVRREVLKPNPSFFRESEGESIPPHLSKYGSISPKSLNSPKPTELVQDYRPRLAFREFPLDQKLRCHTVYLGDDEGIDAGPIQPSAAAL